MKRIVVINRKGGCGKSTIVLALADVLKKARVVDFDNQKTITKSSKLTGRHVPVSENFTDCDYLIFDTPPFQSLSVLSILKHVDKVIIPFLIGYPDLIAGAELYDFLIEKELLNKSIAIFNKVRNPKNKSYFQIKKFWKMNYPYLQLASCELSELRDFQDVVSKKIEKKARQQMLAFVEELNI